MNRADIGADGAAAARWASAVAVVVLCLLMVTKIFDAASSGFGQLPLAVALFVLPLLYVIPATRPWWMGHRGWLLGAQAVLTYVPFAAFGNGWVAGLSGLLGGLVLLTVAAPASWLLFGALMAAEGVLWSAVGGYPGYLVASGTAWVLIAYVGDCLLLAGVARLADMVAKVHAARGELAGMAVTQERLEAAEALQAAVGERLASVAALAESALSAMVHSHASARERIAQAGAAARQALSDVRRIIAGHQGPAQLEAATAPRTATDVAPRLAQALLIIVLCLFAAQSVNLNLAAHVRPTVTAAAVADAVAIVALQLRHSRPSRESARPRGWPWTLALQAVLSYAMLPFLGGQRGLIFAGFLAGSLLLLLPGRWAWAAYAAVVVSQGVAYAVSPLRGVPEISNVGYLVALVADIGLLVYGLSRLAALAVQLEALQGELARAARAAASCRVCTPANESAHETADTPMAGCILWRER